METSQITSILREYKRKYQSYVYTSIASLAIGALTVCSCSYTPKPIQPEEPLKPIPISLKLQDLNKDGKVDGIVKVSNDSQNYIFIAQSDESFRSLTTIEKEKRQMYETKMTLDRSQLEEEIRTNKKDLEGKIK